MRIINKRANFEYHIYDRIEAGIALTGGEAKAARDGSIDISNSYVKIMSGEAYLINTNIPIHGKKDYDATHSRKLLLHKKEIINLQSQMKAKRLTLIPISLYTKHRLVKVELALARSKRNFEKRIDMRKRAVIRDIERELRVKE